MKIGNLLGLAIGIGLTQPLLLHAQDMFAISWRGTIHYDDGTGRTVTKSYSDKDAVKMIADNNGLDPRDLVLVYRPDALDTAVVHKSTGEVVADYLQMPDISRLGSSWMTDVTSNGQTVRQAFIFDEHSNPI